MTMPEGDGNEPATFTQAQVDEMLAGLKTKNSELIAAEKRAQAALKNYDGVDPEEYKALKKAAEDAERKKAAAEGDWKNLEAQLLKKLADAEAGWKARETTLLGTIDHHLVDAVALAELAKHSDSPELLLPHVRQQMRAMEVDGKFVTRVVDASGNVRISKKGSGSEPMSPEELVEEMRGNKTYASAFRGSGSSGGGAQRSTTTTAPGTVPATFESFSANLEKIAKGELKVAVP